VVYFRVSGLNVDKYINKICMFALVSLYDAFILAIDSFFHSAHIKACFDKTAQISHQVQWGLLQSPLGVQWLLLHILSHLGEEF